MSIFSKDNEAQQKRLIEAGLMEEGDTVVDYLQTSAKIGISWDKGWGYFTEQRYIVIPGITGLVKFVVPYNKIRELKKTTMFLFFPIGIKIKYENDEGEMKTLVVSMSKRNKWYDFLAQKAGL